MKEEATGAPAAANQPYRMKGNNFMGEDFLLQTETAKELYHAFAKDMPIVDYHCHLSPQAIAENKPFANMTDIWLAGDHYKWRALRTLGIEEKYITGDATDEEKFMTWAAALPYTMRNPLYHWAHMELKNPFGVTELLNGENGKAIYDRCNELLQQPAFTPRGLLEHFKVEMVGTTRPRISLFMQRFHNLGLIETNEDRFFIIKEKKLSDYLAQIA